MVLCGAFLAVVLVNGGFKYCINTFKGQLGERMLRRFRYQLYLRLLRFPLTYFQTRSSAQIIPMVTAESESLGGFIGDALAIPAFQGGTLLTIILFMFMQDPVLGAAAIALYPVQGYVIPKLQRKVNELGKQRVRTARIVADRIQESAAGIVEIHANDTVKLQLTDFAHLLGRIYDIRFEIYRRKFFVKFLNNFIAQLTPFFFYSIGGYLVIRGNLSFGALVAVLAAYKDMSSPWKELLDFYQQKEDSRIKYEQIVEQFQPAGLANTRLLLEEPDSIPRLQGELFVSNLSLAEDDRSRVVDAVSFNLRLDEHVAVIGQSGSGKSELAPAAGAAGAADRRAHHDRRPQPGRPAARRRRPPRRLCRRHALPVHRQPARQPAARPAAPAAAPCRLRRDGHAPADAPARRGAPLRQHRFRPARRLGRLRRRRGRRRRRIVEAHRRNPGAARLRGRCLQFRPALADRPGGAARADRAAARSAPRAGPAARPTTASPSWSRPTIRERYNTNASVAENLLFGTPIGPVFDFEALADNAYVLSVLDRIGLTEELVEIGRQVAAMMTEMFADLPADHEFFEQFSFISASDLPDFAAILSAIESGGGVKALRPEQRQKLLSLPFKLIAARHRLDVLDERVQQRILEARQVFRRDLPEEAMGQIEFFDPEHYNAAASLQDNILARQDGLWRGRRGGAGAGGAGRGARRAGAAPRRRRCRARLPGRHRRLAAVAGAAPARCDRACAVEAPRSVDTE